MDYTNTHTGRVLQGLSQLGHAICGGSPDIPISGKIGYMADTYPNNSFWRKIEEKVDRAFLRIDGFNHCYRAYTSDQNEDYSLGHGRKFEKRVRLFVMVFVPIIRIATWRVKKVAE